MKPKQFNNTDKPLDKVIRKKNREEKTNQKGDMFYQKKY